MYHTKSKIIFSWKDVESLIASIATNLKLKFEDKDLTKSEIITITNGGIIPATLLAYKLNIKHIHLFPIIDKKIIIERIPKFSETCKYILIDEIYDTGRTFDLIKPYLISLDYIVVFLISRYKIMTFSPICGTILNDKKWVVFPWEQS